MSGKIFFMFSSEKSAIIGSVMLKKTLTSFLIFLFSIFIALSCKSAKPLEETEAVEAISESEILSELDEKPPEEKREYSRRTVIVMLSQNLSDEEAISLAKDYGLGLIYNYRNFASCCLGTGIDYSDKQLDALKARLEKDPRVVSVERDYIIRLH